MRRRRNEKEKANGKTASVKGPACNDSIIAGRLRGRTAKTAGASVKEQAEAGALGNKIVNIGVTSSLNTLNPLLMDGVEINKYATGLMFLPLIDAGRFHSG